MTTVVLAEVFKVLKTNSRVHFSVKKIVLMGRGN